VKLSEELKMSSFARLRVRSMVPDSVLLRASSFIASGVRVRLSIASIERGARANADLRRGSRAWALSARRGVPSFPAQWRAYSETTSSSVAAVRPHAHSGGL